MATMWFVGTTWGDMDWQPIDAPTAEEAIALYKADKQIDSADVCADRVEAWDNLKAIKPKHYFEQGYGAICGWCGYEAFQQEDAVIYRGKATCGECRESKPWRQA